ncbi:MAG: ABC transporter ATP-binding protein [Chthonomonadaceae bacterium]|nr:ABC transporter ATP-binding protein [Chthonomonadaceae bacterium]
MTELIAENLGGGYRGKEVISETNFTVREGEFVGLLGANGGGKTTLLKMLLGLSSPMSGRVLLDGKPLREWSSRERAKRIAYVPQQEAQGFDFSVREIVSMGRYAYLQGQKGMTLTDFEEVNRAIDRLSLLPLAERPLTELSGGELQRVRLARALAQQSPLLVLDEPITHLDPAHGARLMTLLRSLVDNQEKGQRKGVLASLHDLNQASRYCDRILLLSEGKLLVQGTPQTVITHEYLEIAFGIDACIETNPRTGKPFVLDFGAV